jgi:hypothetical protein
VPPLTHTTTTTHLAADRVQVRALGALFDGAARRRARQHHRALVGVVLIEVLLRRRRRRRRSSSSGLSALTIAGVTSSSGVAVCARALGRRSFLVLISSCALDRLSLPALALHDGAL